MASDLKENRIDDDGDNHARRRSGRERILRRVKQHPHHQVTFVDRGFRSATRSIGGSLTHFS
jgi:hypothetical protein